MKSKIVSYDLCTPGRDYKALYEKLKSYTKWGKITESTWLIKSDKTCVDIRDELKAVMDKNDRLVVTETTDCAAWSNVICSSEFLKENL